MGNQTTSTLNVHISPAAKVSVKRYYQERGDTWVLTFSVTDFPHGASSVTFFGTEEQLDDLLRAYEWEPAEQSVQAGV